uniref:Uncharacterized protein n=1 Tax=Anguilla anguilla TaxID=7936 RepID=A0A0E9QJI4_ANGAN
MYNKYFVIMCIPAWPVKVLGMSTD